MQNLQTWLWIGIVVLFTILPMIQNWLKSMRLGMLISQIEKTRGTKVITMIHRQPSGILGALTQRYINLDDSEMIMDTIRSAGEKPIDLVLHTPGGIVLAAEQIARVLRSHKPGVTVIVPQYAMSGGTMLALAANQILMDRDAVLGPIDPQINNMPASAYTRVLAEKEKNAIGDETIMMAHLAEKATSQLHQMAYDLLLHTVGEGQAAEVATMLTEGRWTHDFGLHYEVVQAMGLPVSTAVPPEFYSLMALSSPTTTKAMRKADEKGAASGKSARV